MHYFLDIYISTYMEPIVLLGLVIRTLRWMHFLDPPRALGSDPAGAAEASKQALQNTRLLSNPSEKLYGWSSELWSFFFASPKYYVAY